MWLGRYQLGEEVPLSVRVLTSAGAPVWPDHAPYVDFWLEGATKVKTERMWPVDRKYAMAVFAMRTFLGFGFAVGQYLAVVRCAVAGDPWQRVFGFEIVPGGDEDGPIMAMHEMQRPTGNVVIMQRRSGRLLFRVRPRVSP